MKKILLMGSLVSLTIFLIAGLVWAGRYSSSQASVGQRHHSHSGYPISLPSLQGSAGHNLLGQKNPVPKTIPGTGSARYRWKPPHSYYPPHHPFNYYWYGGYPFWPYSRPHWRVWAPGYWVIYWTPHGWMKIWIPGYWDWWWYDDP